MDQNTKKVGLVNWLILLPAAIFMLMIGRYASSASVLTAAALAGFGLIVALLSYFQMGLLERERFEKLELDELSKSRGSESLFGTAGDDTFPAKRSREIFEKYFIPALTILIFLLQGAAAFGLWKFLPALPPFVADRAMLTMSLMGMMGLILFLIGKYSTGLVRLQGQRLLRPSASYMLFSAYVCFAAAIAMAICLAGYPQADLIVGRILCVAIGLIAVETLFSLVLEVYRVRLRGGESRVLYESRLVGLMGAPEAIFTTAAQALDYQFGFKVSEHWFYQFLRKSLFWLLAAQFAILILSTCVFVVDTGDEALLERFGQPLGDSGVVGPGLHFKLPWPIDQTTNYHTSLIQTFIVGAEPESQRTVVWTKPHAKEENFLVASRGKRAGMASFYTDPGTSNRFVASTDGTARYVENQLAERTVKNMPTNALGASSSVTAKSPPVNLLSVSIPVQYQITNLSAWAYVNNDPESLLKESALREVVQYLASADFDDLMSRGRGAAGTALRSRMQTVSDSLHLGVRIVFVGLEDIHPPQKVADVFEKIVSAAQTKEAKVLDAFAYSFKTNAWASAESSNRVWAAESDQHRSIVTASARAGLFTNQALAYSAAPGRNGIYEQHSTLQTWVAGSKQSRKYVVATTNTPSVIIYNLEDKVRGDLIENLPAPSSK